MALLDREAKVKIFSLLYAVCLIILRFQVEQTFRRLETGLCLYGCTAVDDQLQVCIVRINK